MTAPRGGAAAEWFPEASIGAGEGSNEAAHAVHRGAHGAAGAVEDPQGQAPRAPVVLGEEPAPALVETRPERPPVLERAAPDEVHRLGPGHEPDPVAGGPRAHGQVGILVINEEALVEAAQVLEDGRAHEEARPGEAFALDGLGAWRGPQPQPAPGH